MAVALRTLWLLAGIFCALPVLASSLLETVSGIVTAGSSPAHLHAGDHILTGSKIVTAPRSQATLRLADGHIVVLAENSAFTVAEFALTASDPKTSTFILDLHKGTLRLLSSPSASRARGAYVLRVPEASLGILGADFLAALANGTYVSVLKGTLTASNSAGSAVLGSGMAAFIGSPASLATPVPAVTFPLAVTARFERLGAMVVKTTWMPIDYPIARRAESPIAASAARSR